MFKEQFDVVDLQDNVIGVTDKEAAHREGLIHRVAAVYALAPDGRLYVQEHKKSGGAYDHSVGGHVSQGETYDEAARREASEELGLTQPLKKLSIFYSDEQPTMKHMFGLYECRVDDNWEFQPNEEVERIIPMALDEIVDLMNRQPEKFTTGFLHTMREYLSKKGLSLRVTSIS